MTKTVLFLPGLLCDRALWEPQLTALGNDYECVVADMTQDDTLEGMASRAIEGLSEQFSVIGLSMGGYASLAVMRIAPERVERLALLDTSARADDEERRGIRRNLMARVRAGEFDQVVEDHIHTFVHPSRLEDETLMATIRESALNVGAEAYLRQMMAIMTRPDSRDSLARVTCPTLVLCGAEDALTPPELHTEMAENIPNARLEMIAGSGHLPTIEKPEAVNAVLMDWLAS